jgi:hypothetical protein
VMLTGLTGVMPGKICGDNDYEADNGRCKSCRLLCDPAYNTVAQCHEMCPGMHFLMLLL